MIIFGMMFFKGVLASLAGPAPNYDMQRILATRNPREAAMMSGMVNVVLFFPRYLMIAGITVLALAFCMPELRAMDKPDFEEDAPHRFDPVRAGGRGRFSSCRFDGGIHVQFRRHTQRRARLCGERHLQAIHQPQRLREKGGAPEPDRFAGVPRRRHRLRFADHKHHGSDDVAGRGALRRLRHGQRAQVVLVALQRLRIFLGHDFRHSQRRRPVVAEPAKYCAWATASATRFICSPSSSAFRSSAASSAPF